LVINLPMARQYNSASYRFAIKSHRILDPRIGGVRSSWVEERLGRPPDTAGQFALEGRERASSRHGARDQKRGNRHADDHPFDQHRREAKQQTLGRLEE
jgi:hypothetical protein